MIAVENHLGAGFEFVEIYKKEDPLLTQLGLALLDEASSDTPSGRLYADSLVQTLTLHVLKSYSTATSLVRRLNGGLPGYKLRRVKEYRGDHEGTLLAGSTHQREMSFMQRAHSRHEAHPLAL